MGISAARADIGEKLIIEAWEEGGKVQPDHFISHTPSPLLQFFQQAL